jgi:hypothetical protein
LLSGAGLVGQQVTQRLAGEHLAVDGRDLVRQRFDERGMDGQDGIEEVGQVDAVRFGRQAEEVAVAGKGPGAAGGRHFQAGFVLTEEELVARPAVGALVEQFHGVAAVPADVDDGDALVGGDTGDLVAGFEFFEFSHNFRQITLVVTR